MHRILKKIGILFSKLQYGITVYGCAKLKSNDPSTSNTFCLQIITTKMMRIIKAGRNTTREWDTERLCSNLNLLIITRMIIKFKLLEIWKGLNVENYPLQEVINPMLNMNISDSQITIRPQTYNTLRPRIGTMLHKRI